MGQGITWLNRDVLVHVLGGAEGGKDVEVVSWKCEPAVPPGLNYQSQLFRVTVQYRVAGNDCSTSIIAKVPLDGDGKDSVDAFNGTEREVAMYHKVLPKLVQLHSWRGAPLALPSPLPDVIFMEDLREQGYRMYKRGELLDPQHCKEVLKNLSTFHAISVSLCQEHPELIDSVGKDTRFISYSEELDKYWKDRLGDFASLKECAEFAPKIRRKIDTFYPSVVEMFKPSSVLNVLTHDDMWINNFMFRYDEFGAVEDSKLVDYQSPRYCSFSADLVILWWSSVDLKVRELHQEEMFEMYRQNLNKTLEEVNCLERLSKEDFDTEVRRFSPYALRPVAIHLKFSSGDQYYEILPTVLRQMDEFGVFL